MLRRKSGRTGKDEKDLERLSDLEQELQDFRAELLRVAAFWKPNLNDGVQISAAPLWRLFAHKPWQKRLRETWEKLEQGEYDWAHLAYSIWPERVRGSARATSRWRSPTTWRRYTSIRRPGGKQERARGRRRWWRMGRCLGRSNFNGAYRIIFHYCHRCI